MVDLAAYPGAIALVKAKRLLGRHRKGLLRKRLLSFSVHGAVVNSKIKDDEQ